MKIWEQSPKKVAKQFRGCYAGGSPMKSLRFLLPAALVLTPAPALTQQEMLRRYEQAALSLADIRRQGYQQGMLMWVDDLPRSGDKSLRPDEVYRLRAYCLAEDGKRMGCLCLEVKENGRVVRILSASQPGEYLREGPFIFADKHSGARITWRFEGEAFSGLNIDYGRRYLSGVEYGADGKVKTVSFIPSLYRSPTPLPSVPEELPVPDAGELEPSPPVIDLSELEGSLTPPGENEGYEGVTDGGGA